MLKMADLTDTTLSFGRLMYWECISHQGKQYKWEFC